MFQILLPIYILKVQRTSMSFTSLFWALEDCGGPWLGCIILIFILIWAMLFDSTFIQIKIKMPNPNQELPVSSKPQNEDLKDMDVLCTFKFKIESQNMKHGSIKCQWQHSNQDQDAKIQSGTSSVLQSPKSRLEGHGCTLFLQNQERQPKLGTWLYQTPVTKSK